MWLDDVRRDHVPSPAFFEAHPGHTARGDLDGRQGR